MTSSALIISGPQDGEKIVTDIDTLEVMVRDDTPVPFRRPVQAIELTSERFVYMRHKFYSNRLGGDIDVFVPKKWWWNTTTQGLQARVLEHLLIRAFES